MTRVGLIVALAVAGGAGQLTSAASLRASFRDATLQSNQNNTDMNKISDDDGWQWATTTYFDGEPIWPNTPSSTNLALDKITVDPSAFQGQIETRFGLNAIRGGRMAAAVPWAHILDSFGGRSNMVENIVSSAQGSSSTNQCFLVQPINVPPTDYSVDNINSEENVVPIAMDGNRYVYLIVPYQGCGGDGNMDGNDVFNSCFSAIPNAQDAIGFIEGDLQAWSNVCSDPTPSCKAICTMYQDGKITPPSPDGATGDAFVENGSCVIGVSKKSSFGLDTRASITSYEQMQYIQAGSHCATYTNWCSGANMHMDAAIDNPFWTEHYSAASLVGLNRDIGGTNIFIRYKAVPCDIWGSFDPSA